ncbi:hypothetical protein MMC12_004256 [Toensbergia leucococca]|nr:hypothetical protein [Toensbergia leucococca]
MKSIFSLFTRVFAASATATQTSSTPGTLNVTAILGKNGVSVLECWALIPAFVTSSQSGTTGAKSLALGNVANVTYTVLPPQFDGGAHNAPVVQYVSFLSGLAHVTLPTSTESVWVAGGKYGLIIAADTAGVSKGGHITTYPSSQETVALSIPTLDGRIPDHEVLHEGACRYEEQQLK